MDVLVCAELSNIKDCLSSSHELPGSLTCKAFYIDCTILSHKSMNKQVHFCPQMYILISIKENNDYLYMLI
jgi:hypothetical protein